MFLVQIKINCQLLLTHSVSLWLAHAQRKSLVPATARAWFFSAQLDVNVHKRLANPDTDTIFPECIREVIDTRASYLAARLA